MVPPPSTDIIDAIAHPAPPAIPISDEKHGQTRGWKAASDGDEKKGDAIIETVELREGQPKSRRLNYARSLRDFFSVRTILQCGAVLVKFGKFTGPGTIISVAYVDPDNFQTAITSGAEFEYKLLFMVLVSNLIAIYLQVCAVPRPGNSWWLCGGGSHANQVTGVVCQARLRHGHGSGADESSVSSALVEYWLVYRG